VSKYPAVESYQNAKATRSILQSFADRNRNFPLATDLMRKMLLFDPKSRIGAGEALQHPWFKDLPQYTDVHRTCPLGDEFEDEKLDDFIVKCGGY
jgi:serine/threonine protein kinase